MLKMIVTWQKQNVLPAHSDGPDRISVNTRGLTHPYQLPHIICKKKDCLFVCISILLPKFSPYREKERTKSMNSWLCCRRGFV